jgi:hypothetical protein
LSAFFGRISGVFSKRRKPGFPLQSFLPQGGKKVFPLQSLARLQIGAFFRRIRRYLFW